MFEKDYKDAMNSIKPSPEVKNKILNKINSKEEKYTKKNNAIPWRIAFACVVCAAIVLGVVFVPKNATKPDNSFKTLKVAKSYDEIYKLVKPDFSIGDWINAYGAKNAEIMEEYETANGSTSNGKFDDADGTTASDSSDSNEFSNTTEQVEGVSESDIVKTDGNYIYSIFNGKLNIYKADGENSVLLSSTPLQNNDYKSVYGDMFLNGDKVIILKPNDYLTDLAKNTETDATADTVSASPYIDDCTVYGYDNYVTVMIYDVSDRQNPKLTSKNSQKGWYNSSRMIGNYIYLISENNIAVNNIDKNNPLTFVPSIVTDDVCTTVPADSIYRYSEEIYDRSYTVICAYNSANGKMTDTVSLLGGTENIYCSSGNIILTDTDYYSNSDRSADNSEFNTIVSRLEISNGKIEYKTTGTVEGNLENQFFIDEYNGYFRFVTTVTKTVETKQKFANTEEEVVSYSSKTSAKLTVLDSDLKTVSSIENLAEGERVYSVRFMGDIAYFVTFRQTDPLFSADLSDPKNPKILGELKISGFSEYMYPYGDGMLLGFGMEADENTGRTSFLKLSMFDVSNPQNVTEQDKTVIDGYYDSPALYNHKAMLVFKSKNLIGFAAEDSYGNVKYMLYEHKDGAFNRVAVLETEIKFDYDIRGLFINDNFYLVSQKGLQVFDINTFLQTATVES